MTLADFLILAAVVVYAVHFAVAWRCWREYKARKADQLMFLTHTPQAYQPGKVHNGNVVTRLVQVAPTALVDGGLAPCWKVYGKPRDGSPTPLQSADANPPA
jgi:hypothetical protein